MALLHPGPHAFLFVVKIGRFTQEEEGTYKRLVAIFDKEVTKYMVIVFTGGDNLRSAGQTIDDIISSAPAGLKDILKDCGGRYVVFDNLTADKKPQVNRLLNIVVQMVKDNNNERYTCPKYISVGEKMEEEIQKRMMEVEKREHEHKQYIRQLEMNVRQLEEDARKERKEYEEREKARKEKIKKKEEKMERKIQKMYEKLELKSLTDAEMEKQMNNLLKENQDLVNQIEKKQEEDRKQTEEKQRKLKEEADKVMEDMKKAQEESQEAYDNEINQLKDGIAQNEEKGLLARMAEGIVETAAMVWRVIRVFFS